MTTEERQLLLADLCARLPYGVNISLDEECNARLTGIDEDGNLTADIPADFAFSIDDIKPYFRPLNTMTEEEYETFPIPYSFDSFSTWNNTILSEVVEGTQILIGIDEITEIINWLNAHHFDYRGLIEKGLALPAPNGMYNEQND